MDYHHSKLGGFTWDKWKQSSEGGGSGGIPVENVLNRPGEAGLRAFFNVQAGEGLIWMVHSRKFQPQGS